MASRPALSAASGLTRRSLLAAAGAATLAACAEVRAAPLPRRQRLRYGMVHPSQYGDLVRPEGAIGATVVLLHGGWWRAGFGNDLMEPAAADLRESFAQVGVATWNVEYRRLGDGGGWPTTFEDVAAAIDLLATLPDGRALTRQVLTLGHSAGGHLAAWAASRTSSTPGGSAHVLPAHTFSLSGILDLTEAARQNLGQGSAVAMGGGPPDEVPGHYLLADPTALLPPYGTVVAVHASDDAVVTAAQSEDYVVAVQAAGGRAGYHSVPGAHMDLVRPTTEAWREIRLLVADALGTASRVGT